MPLPASRTTLNGSTIEGSMNDRLASLATTVVKEKGGAVEVATMGEFECPPYDLDVELSYRFLRDTVWVGVSWYRPGGKLGPATLAAADLLKPGRLAGTGFTAAWPLLDQVSQLMGFTSFFDNFLTIVVLFALSLATLSSRSMIVVIADSSITSAI